MTMKSATTIGEPAAETLADVARPVDGIGMSVVPRRLCTELGLTGVRRIDTECSTDSVSRATVGAQLE